LPGFQAAWCVAAVDVGDLWRLCGGGVTAFDLRECWLEFFGRQLWRLAVLYGVFRGNFVAFFAVRGPVRSPACVRGRSDCWCGACCRDLARRRGLHPGVGGWCGVHSSVNSDLCAFVYRADRVAERARLSSGARQRRRRGWARSGPYCGTAGGGARDLGTLLGRVIPIDGACRWLCDLRAGPAVSVGLGVLWLGGRVNSNIGPLPRRRRVGRG